jgi:hypothetical protein
MFCEAVGLPPYGVVEHAVSAARAVAHTNLFVARLTVSNQPVVQADENGTRREARGAGKYTHAFRVLRLFQGKSCRFLGAALPRWRKLNLLALHIRSAGRRKERPRLELASRSRHS